MLRIRTLFSMGVLSSAFFMSAQVTNIQLVAPAMTTGSCPIDFSAQRSGGPTKMVVDSGTRLRSSQQVLLRFGNTTRHNISGMSVIVHGLTGMPHAVPVVSEGVGPATRSTRAALKLAIGSLGIAETTLRVDGITSIRTIDLDSVEYDDGSQWRANADRPCTIVPNGFMLVASR